MNKLNIDKQIINLKKDDVNYHIIKCYLLNYISENNLKKIKYLVNNGLDVNVIIYLRNETFNILNYIIYKCDDYVENVYLSRRIPMIKYLLKKGIDINNKSLLHYNIENTIGITPLMKLISRHYINNGTIDYLLNIKKLIKLLLKYGADPFINYIDNSKYVYYKNYYNAFYMCIKLNQIELLKLLIKHSKTKINTKDNFINYNNDSSSNCILPRIKQQIKIYNSINNFYLNQISIKYYDLNLNKLIYEYL